MMNSPTKLKKKSVSILVSAFRYLMLTIIGYIVLYPLLYMISGSLKEMKALLDVRYIWIPRYISFDTFKTAFDYLDFIPSLTKTLSLQIVSALIEIFVCSFIAYGFARFDFKIKKIATAFLMLSLMVPLPMYSLSLSVNFRELDFLGILGLLDKFTGIDLRLNLFDTNWVYWLPSIFGVGIRAGILIYIYIQFFKGLPGELEDAAYVDGAGPIRTFLQIALPSSSVVIVTVSVLSIVWHWNESYLASLCFTNETKPLSVMLSLIEIPLHQDGLWLGTQPIANTIVFASCIAFIIIPLILYLILQRKFVKSIDRVGITG
ncbi:MAG: carbohydrate ABC transporter permease [Ruminococcaceae bacterium]|nr:carbohydrate ABC transporter permease [Oscillospiraceae bacterium]